MQTLMLVTLLASIDLGAAQRAHAELQAMCAADKGRLWGREVCGRIVFAEAGTRDAVRLHGEQVEQTRIPDSIGIANTAVQWDGEEWTMVMWPLPQGTVARRALLGHESFHRIQDELGLKMTSPANAHLEGAEARALMRLEWRALARALATRDEEAVADAVLFRMRRHTLAAGAGEEERLLEMNEGLAEYTGYALAVPHVRERIAALVRKLANAEKGERFARSFAYTTGPAWGTLFEMHDPRWTRRVKAGDDFVTLAMRTRWYVPDHRAPRLGAYDGEAVFAEERSREEKKKAIVAELRTKFVDGPVLTIPLLSMQFTFDPNEVQPLEGLGSVYRSMEVRDVWGKIVVTGGGLISADFKRLIVPAAADGYELILADGWKVVDGARAGDKSVSKMK
ncbi:MAG TPA: hypothetical protein VEK57_30280 [Thermoanaerobaculia bacterium]|nr:hypothetical protein [Thermoanaerobaculia bacterium]